MPQFYPLTKCKILTPPDGRLIPLNLTTLIALPDKFASICNQPINFTAQAPT